MINHNNLFILAYTLFFMPPTLEAGTYYSPKHRTREQQKRLNLVIAEMRYQAKEEARRMDEDRRKAILIIDQLMPHLISDLRSYDLN